MLDVCFNSLIHKIMMSVIVFEMVPSMVIAKDMLASCIDLSSLIDELVEFLILKLPFKLIFG